MALLVSLTDVDAGAWVEVFRRELEGMDIRIYPNVGDESDIEYVAAWHHPFGEYKKYTNLKAILSLGAGVDHIIQDPELPISVPIVRMADEALIHDMCLYVLHWVLHYHSDYYRYTKQQQTKQWLEHKFIAPKNRTIGIMGLGSIGMRVGEMLSNQGFNIVGWGATEKHSADPIEYFYGKDQLKGLLNKSEILINILPLTESTNNLIQTNELQQLPEGAFIINIGRGSIINENNLLTFLNNGHIAAAILDVFDVEPLPLESPLWSHPNVVITPHIAGQSDGETGAMSMVDNIRRIELGKAPFPLYDSTKGY